MDKYKDYFEKAGAPEAVYDLLGIVCPLFPSADVNFYRPGWDYIDVAQEAVLFTKPVGFAVCQTDKRDPELLNSYDGLYELALAARNWDGVEILVCVEHLDVDRNFELDYE